MTIPWHIKFLLFFKKTHVSMDFSSEAIAVIYYKTLFDKIYVVGEERHEV